VRPQRKSWLRLCCQLASGNRQSFRLHQYLPCNMATTDNTIDRVEFSDVAASYVPQKRNTRRALYCCWCCRLSDISSMMISPMPGAAGCDSRQRRRCPPAATDPDRPRLRSHVAGRSPVGMSDWLQLLAVSARRRIMKSDVGRRS